MHVDVLGPIRVRDHEDRDLTPTGVLQRRLLALLVLQRGRVVSVDAAAEALWPGGVPRDPAVAVQNHVFRLRRALPADVIGSIDGGYRLDPAAVVVDADRLAEALAAPDDHTLDGELDAILARWRGPAYPELDDVDQARAEVARLDELRLRARERVAERLLADDIGAAIASLTRLVDDEPLRERPRALLMSALVADGRAPEALRTYDDFRRRLADELGIEPSPSLIGQHAALLAPTTRGIGAGRVPTPPNSLVGREGALAELDALLRRSRLVTLTGPGGVGKTRLLVEFAHERPDRPATFCELAATDGAAVLDTVAAVLGIDARRGPASAALIADAIGERAVLMLLDNCEHVLDEAAALVEHLLARCPSLTVVATSRERLRLPGEQLFVVAPLPAAAIDDPAAELFVERARAIDPAFSPTADDRRRIVEIVRRLDGLPLAIELAAARLHTLDLDEIAGGLDDRFALLAAGYRTSARHESLEAAMSWSYELLDADLRATFADLAVFAGSFDLADAAAVSGNDVAVTRRHLDHLVERSLVTRPARRRYVLLETMRAFAADQLMARGGTAEVGARHAEHVIALIETADVELFEPSTARLAELDAAVPELRNALGWLLDHDRTADAGRLITAATMYGLFRVRPDVLAWADLVGAADPDDASPWAPQVWAAAAYGAWLVGDIAGSGERSRRALAACARAGTAVPPLVATTAGNIELFAGHLDRAADWYRRATAAAGDHRGQWRVAASTELLALAYAEDPSAAVAADTIVAGLDGGATPYSAYSWYCAGEAAQSEDVARARLLRAVEQAEATGAVFVTGLAGAALSAIDVRTGDPHAAAEDHRRFILLWRRSGAWSTLWTLLRAVIALLVRLERYQEAAVLEGAVRSTAAGHRIFGADERALAELGDRMRTELGDTGYEAARREGEVLDGDGAVAHALRALEG